MSQNKIVRFILDLGPRSHVGQCELDRAGMLNTKDRAKQLTLNHMYNIYHQTAPGYLCENFERVSHCYGTRYMQNNFFLDKPQGIDALYWNNLPNIIKLANMFLKLSHTIYQNSSTL